MPTGLASGKPFTQRWSIGGAIDDGDIKFTASVAVADSGGIFASRD
jgi:hypothetical protein